MDATNCQNLFELRHKSVTRYFNFRILFNVLCLLSSFYCVSFSPDVQITVLLRVFCVHSVEANIDDDDDDDGGSGGGGDVCASSENC